MTMKLTYEYKWETCENGLRLLLANFIHVNLMCKHRIDDSTRSLIKPTFYYSCIRVRNAHCWKCRKDSKECFKNLYKKKVGEFFNYTTLGRMNNCRSVKRKFPLTKFYIVFGWLREWLCEVIEFEQDFDCIARLCPAENLFSTVKLEEKLTYHAFPVSQSWVFRRCSLRICVLFPSPRVIIWWWP